MSRRRPGLSTGPEGGSPPAVGSAVGALRVAVGWTALLRLVARGASFLQLFILARLLTPREFGIYGAAMLSVTLVDAFTETGFEDAVIQDPAGTNHHLDTLFVANLGRGALVSLITVGLAWPVSVLMDERRALSLFAAVALLPLITATTNPAAVEFRRNLDLKREFRYRVPGVIAGLVVSVTVAVLTESAWALVVGLMTAHSLQVLMSYRLRPYRPRIRVEADSFRTLFTFGKWLWAARVAKYFAGNVPVWILGTVLGSVPLGIYQVGGRVAQGASTEISKAVATLAFPALAALQGDSGALRRRYLDGSRIISILSVPIFMLIALVPHRVIDVFLGGGAWSSASGVVVVLAVNGLMQSMGAQAELMRATGDTRMIWIISLARAVVVSVPSYALVTRWGPTGAAMAVLLGTGASIVLSVRPVLKAAGATMGDLAPVFGIPLLSALGLAGAARLGDSLAPAGLVGLLVVVLGGLGAYLASAMVLDRFTGRDLRRCLVQLRGTRIRA